MYTLYIIIDLLGTVTESEQYKKLKSVDSPTIANVIELFDDSDYTSGYTNSSIQAVYPELPPILGYAITAKGRCSSPPKAGEGYSGFFELVELVQKSKSPTIVVLEDIDKPCIAASYGEIMARSFKKFGAEGLITNGAGRDYLQVKEIGFPCWTSSTIVSHGYFHIEEIDVNVEIGGLLIQPGDLLHADANGIIRIPSNLASKVADRCQAFIEAENILIKYLNEPNNINLEEYEAIRQKMRKSISELRIRS